MIADGQVCRTIVRESQPTSGDRATGHSEHGSEAPGSKPELLEQSRHVKLNIAARPHHVLASDQGSGTSSAGNVFMSFGTAT